MTSLAYLLDKKLSSGSLTSSTIEFSDTESLCCGLKNFRTHFPKRSVSPKKVVVIYGYEGRIRIGQICSAYLPWYNLTLSTTCLLLTAQLPSFGISLTSSSYSSWQCSFIMSIASSSITMNYKRCDMYLITQMLYSLKSGSNVAIINTPQLLFEYYCIQSIQLLTYIRYSFRCRFTYVDNSFLEMIHNKTGLTGARV